MKHLVIDPQGDVELMPSALFAMLKACPLMICTLVLLCLGLKFWSPFVLVALFTCFFAFYRYWYIRSCRYQLGTEIIRITRGICFQRTDQVELYRLKDYIVYRPFLLQVFGLMDLELKGTDPENPVVWLRGIPYSDIVDTIRERVQGARKQNQIVELN